MKKILFLLITIILYSLSGLSYISAYNLKQITNNDGLSNSSVMNLYQDSNNFMWFCTFDGLNMYDGSKIHVYRSQNSSTNFSSHVVRQALETDPGTYWLITNLGLNKFTIKGKKVEKYFTDTDPKIIAKNNKNELFAVVKSGYISYYNNDSKSFEDISLPGLNNFWVRSFNFDSQDNLWIFMSTGTYWKLSVKEKNGKKYFVKLKGLPTKNNMVYSFYENGLFYFIDQQRNFLTYDVKTDNLKLFANVKSFVEPNGVIRAIVAFEDGFLFGFEYNGLYKVRFPSPGKSEIQKLDISCGVYNILKDKSQDIYWIATDGQGVYMYWNDDFSVRNYTKEELPVNIQKPVRALYLDKNKNLWIGTKGEGILKIRDYSFNASNFSNQSIDRYHIQSNFNYKLVFCFEESRNNILWIGGDWPGLTYYSYRDNKTYQTNTITEINPLYINFVHAIVETNDSTLWIGTYGMGFLKAVYSKKDFKIKSVKKYNFKNGISDTKTAFDRFNSVYQENDSILWLGARMNGAIRFNMLTEKYTVIHFDKEKIEQLNDVLSICKDRKGNMWFGTNFGLVRLINYNNNTVDYEVINESNGLTNNSIAGILEDNQGSLYLSSNKGIDIYNPETKKIRRINNHNGLKINEFSLDAFHKNPDSDIMFFGGTNGFSAIRHVDKKQTNYDPKVHFMGISIFGTYYDLSDFIQSKRNKEYVKLKYSQNFFSIDFVALDYINGINTEYMYQLENYSKVWIDLGKNNTATFTNIPPGEYKLNIKCKTEAHDFSNNIQSLSIVITPPWYASLLAKIIYYLMLGGVIWFTFYYIQRKIERNRMKFIEKLKQEQKQEIYDSKLNFWSKIVQEFSTPLTLITGPCQLLLNYASNNPYISEYVNLIYSNAEKMSGLIRQLHEFRQVNPENNKCVISNIDTLALAKSTFNHFAGDAEKRSINYQLETDENSFWNTNEEVFSKIINILLTNALIHTNEGGTLKLTLKKSGTSLKLTVYYTGKGMNKDQSEKLFNRYDIMDNIEGSEQTLATSESILGLGICHNLVKILQGEITVESEPGRFTQFEVSLPYQEINLENQPSKHIELPKQPETTKGLNQPVVLIIDRDEEMLWFLKEIFSSEYVVYTVSDSELSKNLFETKRIDIVILNEDSFIDNKSAIDYIKNNPGTKHIPLILLSSNPDWTDELSPDESGADAYIRKPFNVDYLKKRVVLMLKNKEYLKEYFTSSLSSYELLDGQLIHQEDKELLKKIIEIIDKNITDAEINSDYIAEQLHMSKRKFYRKMKELTNNTPTEFIKSYKLELSAGMLRKSNATVQEIMYKAGFNNRAYFYKEFMKKYNVSPGKYREMN